mgnify:FL=1
MEMAWYQVGLRRGMVGLETCIGVERYRWSRKRYSLWRGMVGLERCIFGLGYGMVVLERG